MPTKKRQCAFCPSTAKLTAEHLWSEWINDLLPGRKLFKQRDARGQIVKTWVGKDFNWKAKVVCGRCNNTWMGDIENQHAKTALSDLIIGKSDVPIDSARARSIALFSFKTAAVFDLISSNHAPFFRRDERYAFKDSLDIPTNVKMWMGAFSPGGRGDVHTGYLKAATSPAEYIQCHVCIFSAEHFVFQLLAARTSRRFFPILGFEKLAVPFWPRFEECVWPPPYTLKTAREFDAFSLRWKRVTFLG
jgi:hypothetical protein